MGALPNPLIAAFKAQQQQPPDAMPALGNGIAMPNPVPSMGAPVLPNVIAPKGTTNGDINERDRLINTGAGVDQVKNPLLKGLAKTADIVGSVFAPNLAQFIPGTTLHHNMLVNQATQNVQNDLGQEDQAAQVKQREGLAEQEQAKAAALTDPHKAVDPSKTVTTDDGVFQLNPETGRYDIPIGDRVQKPQPPHYVTTGDGNVVAITQDKDGKPTASTVYEGTPKQATEITKLEVNGKPHTVIVDKNTGATVKDLGETGEKPPSVSVSSGTYSIAQVPDGKGGLKSVLLNNKTGELKETADGLQKPAAGGGATTADKNRASLAKIALANIDKIQEIIQRRGNDLIGPGPGRVSNIDQIIGSNDPDLVALVNEAHNFSMANAGVHGSRSVMNVRDAVHDLLGDLHNGPRGIQGGLDANRANLNAIINPSASEDSKGDSTEYVRKDGKLVPKGGK